ncbi:hypothetical protein [Rubripirellula tenax]|uniref:hypothetical protein n=1 Tax=Rubripirellula tenax TaxID=2528015 RepID=UPI0011B41543|nr:hypothetical protein [Rubripirellula tenax]
MNCSYHTPNGDTTFGESQIQKFQEQKDKQGEENRRHAEEIERLKTKFREQTTKIRAETDAKSRQILSYLETVLDSGVAAQDEPLERLAESAEIASDLFPTPAVELVVDLSGMDDFAEQFLPIASELAKHVDSMSDRFVQMATLNIEQHRQVERSSEILLKSSGDDSCPLSGKAIKNLLNSQNHHFLAVYHDHADYSWSTKVMIRCLDERPARFVELAIAALDVDNDTRRRNVCGAIQSIQAQRPEIAIELLNALVGALQRQERDGQDRPSSIITQILESAFRHRPESVDSVLCECMESQRPAVCEDIVQVYRGLFLSDDQEASGPDKHSIAAKTIALKRIISWVQDSTLDLSIRVEVLEALEIACNNFASEAYKHFDLLLGYFAMICDETNPPDPLKPIALPDEPPENAQQRALKNYSAAQDWHFFKSRLRSAIGELCEEMPGESFDSISGCLAQVFPVVSNSFKAACFHFLGQIGKDFLLRSKTLPYLMKGLMDYSSGTVRAAAIESVVAAFSYSNSKPPSNLVDVITVHLKDSLQVVHQAALQAVRRNSSWFNDQQAIEVAQILPGHLRAYANKPHQVAEICETMLSLIAGRSWLEPFAVRQLETVIPIGERLYDAKVVEQIVRRFRPDGSMSNRVAKFVSIFLACYGRDRYSQDRRRAQGFEWLNELGEGDVVACKSDLLQAAQELAQRDPWDSIHFAAVFANAGLHDSEARVLATAFENIADEPRNEGLRGLIENLLHVANGNKHLAVDDCDAAAEEFSRMKVVR